MSAVSRNVTPRYGLPFIIPRPCGHGPIEACLNRSGFRLSLDVPLDDTISVAFSRGTVCPDQRSLTWRRGRDSCDVPSTFQPTRTLVIGGGCHRRTDTTDTTDTALAVARFLALRGALPNTQDEKRLKGIQTKPNTCRWCRWCRCVGEEAD